MNSIPATLRTQRDGKTAETEAVITVSAGKAPEVVCITIPGANHQAGFSRPAARELVRQILQEMTRKP